MHRTEVATTVTTTIITIIELAKGKVEKKITDKFSVDDRVCYCVVVKLEIYLSHHREYY